MIAMDTGRRKFLTRDIWGKAAKLLHELAGPYKNEISLKKEDDYFTSFDSCYPLISESGELLMEEAIRQGIKTDGKDKVEIAREMFSRQKRSLKGYKEGGDERGGKAEI